MYMAGRDMANLALFMDFGGASPSKFAEVLVKEHKLLVNETYAFSCTSSAWLSVSNKEAEARPRYEGAAWNHLHLNQILTSATPVVNLVGLAVGEGLGEIELLRHALDDDHVVHYLALDLSPVLLAAHVERVREVFAEALAEGRLVCAGFLGNIFTDLERSVRASESEFISRGILSSDDQFLPTCAPLLVTYLGNCLGNDSNDREDLIFDTISSVFLSHKVSILFGISLMRSSPDKYSQSSADFFLQIPRYLTNDLQVLRSARETTNCEPEEFEICPNSKSKNGRMLPVTPRSYESRGIKGQIYDFFYRLDFDLEFPSQNLKAEAGTKLLLYSVTKFDPEALVRFIQNLGYALIYDPSYHERVETEFGPREYTVMLATHND